MFPVWVCCEHRGRRRWGDKEVRASDRAALSPEDLNSIACRQLRGINGRSQLVEQLLQALPQGLSATADAWQDLAFHHRGCCVGALMFIICCHAICCLCHILCTRFLIAWRYCTRKNNSLLISSPGRVAFGRRGRMQACGVGANLCGGTVHA